VVNGIIGFLGIKVWDMKTSHGGIGMLDHYERWGCAEVLASKIRDAVLQCVDTTNTAGGSTPGSTGKGRKSRKASKKNPRPSARSSSAAVLIEGPLMKRSTGVLKRWQSRYFVIAGHYLKYADDEQAVITNPKAAVDLKALHACSVTRDTFLKLDFVDGMVLELQAETPAGAEGWLEVLTQFTSHKDDKQAASMMRQLEHYAPRKGTLIFERKSSSGIFPPAPAPASAPAPVPAPDLSDTASGAGQKTIEPALSDVLGSMDVKEYSARFLDEGYDKLADVCDLTVEELITDIGMKKGHARRLAKHLAALPK
jgi:hypothetical protein